MRVTRCSICREKAEHDACSDGDREDEREYRHADANRAESWERRAERSEIHARQIRREIAEQADTTNRQASADDATGQREEHAFREQLSNEAAAAGANRDTHG